VADVLVRPVRDLDRFPERGAFLLHAGSAESAAHLRVLERRDDGSMLARVRTDEALVLDMLDRFVLWEAGRRRVVGGGVILDVAPPRAATAEHVAFLARRAAAPDRAAIAELCIDEAGAIRDDELRLVMGVSRTTRDGWHIAARIDDAAQTTVRAHLEAAHAERPLEEGVSIAEVRDVIAAVIRAHGGPRDPALPDVWLARAHDAGDVVRSATVVRLPTHSVALTAHAEEIERLRAAIDGEHQATPPTVKELVGDGFDPSLIDAAGRAGIVVRISAELVVTPAVLERATAIAREHAGEGMTVSALREALGTSRKYAVPIAEFLDATGVTRRTGDLRFPREAD
jgi:selenocysteine-specific elongation factor